MDDIRHRVGIKAPIHDVYNAFATAEGLEGGASGAYPHDRRISSWS